ncbi:MAG: YaiO family outer membrane beta-barrel protein [Bryobacteraceae bacterium]|jgi:YaiO family outer membrane protein
MKYILLILLGCMAGVSPAQDLQDLQSRAKTAVSEKRFGEALTLYRTLLAGNPTDVDTILWIARLSAWTSDYAAAADFYSQALTFDPKNVDALVGKANVLLWKHSYPEAFVLLTAARELAPTDTDVELAWARYYHWQGDEKTAKVYLEQCLASDSDNAEALQLKESLVPDHTIQLLIAYEGDTLPGTTPGAIEQLGATYFNRKADIGLDFFHMNRFGEAGSRGGLHFSRKLGARTSVRATALFGGGGGIVPKQDLSAGISNTVMHGLVLGADYRHLVFPAVTVDAAIANLDYYFEKPMWILSNFAANRTAGATTPALQVRFYSSVRKNLTVNGGFGYGTEVFQLALPTDFGAFRRDSYIGGMTLALTKKTRAEATYTLARRSTGVFENMFVLALLHTL